MAHGDKFAKLKSANHQNLAPPNLPAIRYIYACMCTMYVYMNNEIKRAVNLFL